MDAYPEYAEYVKDYNTQRYGLRLFASTGEVRWKPLRLIQCSEDDKNIVCISKERDTLVAWLEREAENRRASKGVISCDVVWEDEGMAFLQGAFRFATAVNLWLFWRVHWTNMRWYKMDIWTVLRRESGEPEVSNYGSFSLRTRKEVLYAICGGIMRINFKRKFNIESRGYGNDEMCIERQKRMVGEHTTELLTFWFNRQTVITSEDDFGFKEKRHGLQTVWKSKVHPNRADHTRYCLYHQGERLTPKEV